MYATHPTIAALLIFEKLNYPFICQYEKCSKDEDKKQCDAGKFILDFNMWLQWHNCSTWYTQDKTLIRISIYEYVELWNEVLYRGVEEIFIKLLL